MCQACRVPQGPAEAERQRQRFDNIRSLRCHGSAVDSRLDAANAFMTRTDVGGRPSSLQCIRSRPHEVG